MDCEGARATTLATAKVVPEGYEVCGCMDKTVFGVIGIQSGPPGRWVHSGFRGGSGAR